MSKTRAEYLYSFSRCPSCDSEEIEGELPWIDRDMALQEVSCLECGAVWEDTYRLEGYALCRGGEQHDA